MKSKQLTKDQKIVLILKWLYENDGAFSSRYEWRVELIQFLLKII